MTLQEVIVLGTLAVIVMALLVCVVRVLVLIKRLNASFAKLGYLVREDAKKYFDDAADKIVDTNEQFQKMYQKIVEDGTRTVLAESSTITEKVAANAHAQANQIILSARNDAFQILQAARGEAEAYSEKTMQQTGDAIGWVMSQYLESEFSVADHESLIEKQVKMYINEHRQ